MQLRNYWAMIGLYLLTEACSADHRIGHLARGEAIVNKDSEAVSTIEYRARPRAMRAGAGNYSYPASLTEVPAGYRSEVAGIDISHWNGAIDWAQVNLESIYFVYMKATEGTNYIDPSFGVNWSGIRSTSLRRGAYHFFLPGLSEKKQLSQAQNFINTVKNLEAGDLPPMLDVEDDPDIPVELFQSRLLTVARKIEAYFSVSPLIYTSKGLYKKYLSWHNSFQHYEVWIADYSFSRPELCDKKNMCMWQFTDRARVPGIRNPVDMDIFYTTPKDLENLVIKK